MTLKTQFLIALVLGIWTSSPSQSVLVEPLEGEIYFNSQRFSLQPELPIFRFGLVQKSRVKGMVFCITKITDWRIKPWNGSCEEALNEYYRQYDFDHQISWEAEEEVVCQYFPFSEPYWHFIQVATSIQFEKEVDFFVLDVFSDSVITADTIYDLKNREAITSNGQRIEIVEWGGLRVKFQDQSTQDICIVNLYIKEGYSISQFLVLGKDQWSYRVADFNWRRLKECEEGK